jgi:hypothetical protein
MFKLLALVVVLAIGMSVPGGNSQMDLARSHQTQQQGDEKSINPGSAIRVTIMTGGGLFGPQKNRFKVGEQVPVSIAMTNTAAQPANVCNTSTLYQELPTLVRDGQTVPYSTWQSSQLSDAKKNHTCENQDLPDPVILKPNESSIVDWFILVDSTVSTGSLAWYDSLAPGKYELTIQRRFGCCDGPMVESNKISFEIVQ